MSLPSSPPAQPHQLFMEYDNPAEDLSYAGRLTRGQAAFRGINVEDYPLPLQPYQVYSKVTLRNTA